MTSACRSRKDRRSWRPGTVAARVDGEMLVSTSPPSPSQFAEASRARCGKLGKVTRRRGSFPMSTGTPTGSGALSRSLGRGAMTPGVWQTPARSRAGAPTPAPPVPARKQFRRGGAMPRGEPRVAVHSPAIDPRPPAPICCATSIRSRRAAAGLSPHPVSSSMGRDPAILAKAPGEASFGKLDLEYPEATSGDAGVRVSPAW